MNDPIPDKLRRTLLTMEGIHKSFPGVHALRGVNFSVLRGEVHALLGENGAGKTTLMHVLAGVYPPDEGRIDFDGRHAMTIADEHKRSSSASASNHRNAACSAI
jgi:ABC-type sugar transport system ATPase subunit